MNITENEKMTMLNSLFDNGCNYGVTALTRGSKQHVLLYTPSFTELGENVCVGLHIWLLAKFPNKMKAKHFSKNVVSDLNRGDHSRLPEGVRKELLEVLNGEMFSKCAKKHLEKSWGMANDG